MAVKIQIRRDSAANWTSANPTLSSGEIALETDTKNVKIGDGTTAWTSLGYVDTGAKGLQAILTTQGDIVYASSANTPARLAAGTEGQVLTMGASVPEWADASGVGYNYIIDGNFQIAQLNPVVGTTVTNPTSGTYPVFDMWKTAQSADGGTLPTILHSQKAIYNDGIAGSTYCYNINVNGAGTSLGVNSYMTLNHYIEKGTRMLAGTGNTVTLSFYGRSTIANKKIGFELVQTYGSGGSPSASEQINGTSTITLTSTRTRYELTFTLNTLVGKTLGTNKDDNIVVEMWTMWGSNLASRVGGSGAETFVGAGDIEISQIKLEAGDTATDFVPEPYAEALRKCMRYLETTFNGVAPAVGIPLGNTACVTARDGGNHIFTLPFKVMKRNSSYTITFYNKASSSTSVFKGNYIALGSGDADFNGTIASKSDSRVEVYDFGNTVLAGTDGLTTSYVVDNRF